MILLFAAPLAYGAQWAIVTAPKAVVFAHPDRTGPIGYVKSGRKLRVGSILRNRGTVLPVIISGKIAWVQIQDLTLLDNEDVEKVERTRFLRTRGLTPRSMEIMQRKAHGHIGLGVGVFNLGQTWKESSQNVNGVEGTGIGSSFFMRYKNHSKAKKFMNWSLGLHYFNASEQDLTLQVPAASGHLDFNLWQEDRWLLELSLGLIYSPSAQLTVVNESASGSMQGWIVGMQGSLHFNNEFGAFGFGGVQSLQTDIKKETTSVDIDLAGATFVGYHLMAALYYRL